MDMLLRDLTIGDLAAMLNRHEGASPVPHLLDSRAGKRAVTMAKRNGQWDMLSKELNPGKSIPVFKRSEFRVFARTGDRRAHETREAERRRELELAALALWLGHPKADADYLQDLIWAYCDDFTWVMAAHEACRIDLGSAGLGTRLAEILCALAPQIEQEVRLRTEREITTRIFDNVNALDWWHTHRANWNHVCNGSIIRAALLLMTDSHCLAQFIHGLIQNMTYALDGFADDGGCLEGPSYWEYGFGHFVRAAHALYRKTGGELNLMRGEKIERICRYPLAAHIDGKIRINFGDAHPGFVSAETALMINDFLDIPELLDLCERDGHGNIAVRGMNAMALYRPECKPRPAPKRDYFLPESGFACIRGKPGTRQLVLAAVAGNNGFPHNHNDIGSFMLYKRGIIALADPGAPLYRQKTFSPQRYEILYCNSLGHSVPVVNGRQQGLGAQFKGRIHAENLDTQDMKRVTIDMTGAYEPAAGLKSLVRTFDLDPRSNRLRLTDEIVFKGVPKSLEEAFVTFEKARVASSGAAVKIGSGRKNIRLKTECPGQFKVNALKEESEDSRPGTLLRRVTFIPARRRRAMTIEFVID